MHLSLITDEIFFILFMDIVHLESIKDATD